MSLIIHVNGNLNPENHGSWAIYGDIEGYSGKLTLTKQLKYKETAMKRFRAKYFKQARKRKLNNIEIIMMYMSCSSRRKKATEARH